MNTVINERFLMPDHCMIRHVQMLDDDPEEENVHPQSVEALHSNLSDLVPFIKEEKIMIFHSDTPRAGKAAILAYRYFEGSGEKQAVRVRCASWLNELEFLSKQEADAKIEELRQRYPGMFLMLISHRDDIASYADVPTDLVNNCAILSRHFYTNGPKRYSA